MISSSDSKAVSTALGDLANSHGPCGRGRRRCDLRNRPFCLVALLWREALESYCKAIGESVAWPRFASFASKRDVARDYGEPWRAGVQACSSWHRRDARG
jgi:hypothetical protein